MGNWGEKTMGCLQDDRFFAENYIMVDNPIKNITGFLTTSRGHACYMFLTVTILIYLPPQIIEQNRVYTHQNSKLFNNLQKNNQENVWKKSIPAMVKWPCTKNSRWPPIPNQETHGDLIQGPRLGVATLTTRDLQKKNGQTKSQLGWNVAILSSGS